MTDTIPKFDPIPRLQQIAATIEESGADIFDAPATAVHYIECAIKEIERLRKERDEARRRYCDDAIKHSRVYRKVGSDTVRCETPQEVAEKMGWDCYKENTNG